MFGTCLKKYINYFKIILDNIKSIRIFISTKANDMKTLLTIYIIIVLTSVVYGFISNNAFFVFGLPMLISLLGAVLLGDGAYDKN